MKHLKTAIKILNKSDKEIENDIHAINLQIRILLNRKAEIKKHQALIKKAVPMSKYRYSRIYLKTILTVFPELDTPSDLNAALCMVRGLSVDDMAKELNLTASAIRARRKQILKKTNTESHEKFCAYFVLVAKDLLNNAN